MTNSNPYLDAITGPSWLVAGLDLNITYRFAGAGWTAAEIASLESMMVAYEAVCMIDFVRDDSGGTVDVAITRITAAEMLAQTGLSAIGEYTHVPDGIALFAGNDPRWIAGITTPGSTGWWAAAHTIGHVLGLGHPDLVDYGEVGSGVFPGVTPGDRQDGGDNDLNSTWTTLMSARWPGAPDHQGRAAGPMAFDIAALQAMYGAREASTGDDRYTLPTTYWKSIWDTGGTDTIVGTPLANVIDLRPATLDNAWDGGGWLSYRVPSAGSPIMGGLTIAHGVLIENAEGGGGNDIIRGNALDNVISGGGGADRLYGFEGGDTFWGGSGADTFYFGADADVDRAVAGNLDIVREFDSGEDVIDILWADAVAVSIVASGANWLVRANTDTDPAWEIVITVSGEKPLLSDIWW